MNKATDRVFSLGFRVGKPIEKLLPNLNGRLIDIMGCLANAISWVHSRLIQHHDIKPANILLRLGQVYVTDFGLSRNQADSFKETTTETVASTSAGYSAPVLYAGGPT